MNNREIFFTKFEEILELMLDGKLRVDIDDTLLEKLLSVFRKEYCHPFCKNECSDSTQLDLNSEKPAYLRVFLDKTAVCKFIENTLCSHESSKVKLNPSVETFALFLLGIFVEQESIFLSEKVQRLLLFLDSFLAENISSLPPSTHVAVLSCVTSIATHNSGISWLVEKGILDIAYSLFSGSTYYVQKAAVKFFTTVLVTWSTSPMFDVRTNGIHQIISSFIERFVMSLQPSHGSEKKYIISNCCISVLRLAMEKSQSLHSFLCEDFQLSSKVLNILKCVLAETEPQEIIIQLLVESLVCSNAFNSSIVTEVLQVFLQHKFVASVIFLMSSFLVRQNSTEKYASKDQLLYVLWPIVTLSGIRVDSTPPEKEFVKTLTFQMTDKNSCIKLVHMSLIALSKLIHVVDTETLSFIMNASVKVLHCTLRKEAQSTVHQNIYGNRKVQISILQFYSAVIEEPVCHKLTSTTILELVDSLIAAVENPTSDSNVTTQALKLICKIQGNHLCDLPKELKKRLAAMVQTKLQDVHWAVVDTCLELIAQIVKGCRDDELWKEWIFTVSIYTAVWDVAANNEAEGYVRATALHVLISLCLCPFMWEKLKSQRRTDEGTIVSVLYKLSDDPDVFVQRESVSSLFRWMQASNMQVPSTNTTDVFKILTNVVKCSLDWDTKLIALRAWQWIAEKELSCFSSPTQKSSVQETLLFLCDIGYGSSVLCALSDHDTTVQYEAAQALLNLRQTLLDLGLDETSVILNSASAASSSISDSSECAPADSFNSSSFQLEYEKGLHVNNRSQTEIDAALNDVLNLDTLGQIHKVLRSAQSDLSIQECSSLFNNSFPSSPSNSKCSCSLGTFWKKLWSKELKSVLTVSGKSTDVYVDNPVALLDDIIAAKTDVLSFSCNEYQEADCY